MISSLTNLVIIFGAILFAFFSWRKIDLGIMAIVFCLPLYLLRLNVFGIPSTVLELGVYILFIIWFVKNYRRIKLLEIIPDKTLRLGIFFLLAGALISTIFSSDIKTSAGILKGWFFDPFLFFLILVSEIKTIRQKENILKALYFSGLAVAAISLFYRFGFFANGVSYDNRLYAFYLSPNYLAMYLSPVLIIGIYFFFKLHNIFFSVIPIRLPAKRNPLGIQNGNFKRFLSAHWRIEMTKYLHFLFQSDKIFWVVSITIISIAIYFTYSYAAWIALAVSLSFMVWFLLKGVPLKKRIFLLSTFYFLLSVLFFSQNGTAKLENLINLSYRSSYNSRLMIWRSAWEIGKDNWLVGIGPGNFQKYYLDYQSRFSEPYLEWAVPEPHNIFLAFWLETGIAGFFGFLIILAWFFKKCLKLLKSNLLDKENFFLVAVLLSMMVYLLIHGLFDTTYWKNDLAVIFWLNLALLVSFENKN